MIDYIDKIQGAINFMEARLKEKVGLGDVAKEAGFSSFHFHRIFLANVGETVTEYLRKRRLSEAARELMETDHRILDIAVDYQFESQQAFTRAFKRMFFVPPGRCRREKPPVHLFYRRRLDREGLRFLRGGVVGMEPKIVELGEIKAVGIRYYGDNKNGEIKQVWDKFNKDMCCMKNVSKPGIALGICSMVEGGDPGKFEYVCSMKVDNASEIPEGMVARVLPPHKYLVFTHKGKLDNLGETYNHIYQNWIPKSGHEIDSSFDFELYDDRFSYGKDESEFDIYIPIK
ncbi:MAG: AraC family transcriptional regulator [Caldisericales bacterium]|nr:AraC family transcriptional regulator [Caldisericia bacterium]NMD14272.1 AraC family transcriptional regulator [Caldisericales bacterium]